MENEKKGELEFLKHLDRSKIEQLKASFELTDRELAIIVKLHAKSNRQEEIYLSPLLNK